MTPASPAADYRLAPEALARYHELRDEAIRAAMAAGEKAMPDYYRRLDARGRAACAEDIGFHLDFLLPTLEEGDLSPFSAYLSWLAEVLASRGVPLTSLDASLGHLADFFAASMGTAGDPVVAALRAASAQDAATHAKTEENCPAPWPESDAYREAALRGNHREANAALTDSLNRTGTTPARTAIHVIQPALYEIGRLWQQNKVSVAREHLATAVSVTVLAQQMATAAIPPGNGLRALFACPSGNQHALGLRMVANAFELDGWDSYYLGENVPVTSLISQVRELRPHLLGLSATLPQHLRSLRESIAALRAAMGNDCPKILIGGLVFNRFPLLARACHADLLATDAENAVSQARQLFPGTLRGRSDD